MTPIRLPLAAVAILATGLAACTNPAQLDPNSNPTANTRDGALIGAGLGAVVGAAVGGSNTLRNAAVGAAVGTIAGAAVGSTLDKQAADLRATLASDGIVVQNTGDSLIVTLPEDVTFDTGSATIRPALQADLERVAANFVAYENSSLQVVGHTDSVGDATFNLGLSQERAISVSNVLLQGGVAPQRVSTIGRGEDDPVASNLTPEGRAQNRRVDIIVLPRNG